MDVDVVRRIVGGVLDRDPSGLHSPSEWVVHHNSHRAPGDNSTITCPLCRQRFEPRDQQFYSHVGHHMDGFRLLSLPPSYRQSENPDDTYQDLDNISDIETLGVFAHSVEEEASPAKAPGMFDKYLRTHDQPDKVHFLGNWFTSAGVELNPEWLSTLLQRE